MTYLLRKWKQWAGTLRCRTRAVYLAYTRYQLPWYTKTVALLVIAYAISPIDLIPDFIPILGYLDDLIILPLGIALVVRLIPKDIWSACLEEAAQQLPRKYRWLAALPIVIIWIGAAVLTLKRILG